MYILYVDGTDANFYQNLLTSDAEVQTVDILHRTQMTAVLNTNLVFFNTATYTTLEEKYERADFFSFFWFVLEDSSVNCRSSQMVTLDIPFMGKFWKPNAM